MGVAALQRPIRVLQCGILEEQSEGAYPSTFDGLPVALATPEKIMGIGAGKRTEKGMYLWRQRHVDRHPGLGAIEEEIAIAAQSFPLQRHRIGDRQPRPTHEQSQRAQPVATVLEIMAHMPVSVGVGGIDQRPEFFFGEVTGGNGLHPDAFQKDGRVLRDPIHAHTEPEEGDQPLVLALGGLRGVSPAGTELRQHRRRELIEVDEPFLVCPLLQLRIEEVPALFEGAGGQAAGLFIFPESLNSLDDLGARTGLGLVGIGLVFKSAAERLRFLPGARLGGFAQVAAIGERTLDPLGAATAAIGNLVLFARRVVAGIGREHGGRTPFRVRRASTTTAYRDVRFLYGSFWLSVSY